MLNQARMRHGGPVVRYSGNYTILKPCEWFKYHTFGLTRGIWIDNATRVSDWFSCRAITVIQTLDLWMNLWSSMCSYAHSESLDEYFLVLFQNRNVWNSPYRVVHCYLALKVSCKKLVEGLLLYCELCLPYDENESWILIRALNLQLLSSPWCEHHFASLVLKLTLLIRALQWSFCGFEVYKFVLKLSRYMWLEILCILKVFYVLCVEGLRVCFLHSTIREGVNSNKEEANVFFRYLYYLLQYLPTRFIKV